MANRYRGQKSCLDSQAALDAAHQKESGGFAITVTFIVHHHIGVQGDLHRAFR